MCAEMELKVWIFLVLLVGHALGSPVDPKIDTRAVEYRLPTTVIPTNYEVILKLATNAFQTNTFEGLTIITITVTENLNEIKLHARDLRIESVQINTAGSVAYSQDTVTDILTLTNSEVIEAGEYTLTIHYFAGLSLSDMRGFYRSSYVDEEGQTQYLATTQFEPTHARRAFPCWDEPGFKATFDVSIVHPNDYTAIANTPVLGRSMADVNLVMTTFRISPRMSTYLNAFLVSKFDCTRGVDIQGDIPYRVCSRPDTSDIRTLAVDFGPRSMAVLEEFTGIPYAESGIGKMDQAAIPDFSAGAMENWGLVTYRERNLLWDPAESSNSYKQSIVNVISHEFAHMWFGNWVTTQWWNDIFLNEGFATYFEFYATAEVFPTWELDKQFAISQVQSALRTDSSSTSDALSSDATTPAEISARFSGISYAKGGSILRMLTHIMGLEQFKLGVRSYLNSHRLGSAVAADLISSLSEFATVPQGTSFAEVMQNWIYEAGYPLITVRVSGPNVTVSQRRFLRSGESATRYYVPLSYTVSTDNNKFVSTTAREWLPPDHPTHRLQLTLGSSEWIILNNQQTGFYRVNYDDTLWDRIVTGLHRANFDGIHVLNRAQLVDDLFTFSQVDEIPFATVLDRIHFLTGDTSYFPWYSAFNGFSTVLDRIGSNAVRSAIWQYILRLMDQLYNSVSFSSIDEDDQIYTLKQVLTLRWACRLGNADCITKAKELFWHFSSHNMIPNKNLRSIVYCTALRNSDDIEKDWNFLWNRFVAETLSTEQVTIINALGCTRNETILKQYLKKATTVGSEIRRQDSSTAVTAVYSSNPDGVRVVLNFIIEDYDNILNYYGQSTLSSLIRTLAGMFTTDIEIQQLDSLINSGKLTESMVSSIQASLESAKTNLEWIKNFEKHLSDYFNLPGGGGDAPRVGVSIATLLICLSVILYELF